MDLKVGDSISAQCVWMSAPEPAVITGYPSGCGDCRPVTGHGEAIPEKRGVIVHLQIGKRRIDAMPPIDLLVKL